MKCIEEVSGVLHETRTVICYVKQESNIIR